MKHILLTLTITLSSVALFAQTKPTVKHKITVSHDSLVNEIDTIPVLFKELVVKPDTVYERWQKGFILWQTWRKNESTLNFGFGNSRTWVGTYEEPAYYKLAYEADKPKADKFLYQNHQPVTNKVLTVFKR